MKLFVHMHIKMIFEQSGQAPFPDIEKPACDFRVKQVVYPGAHFPVQASDIKIRTMKHLDDIRIFQNIHKGKLSMVTDHQKRLVVCCDLDQANFFLKGMHMESASRSTR